MIYSKTRADSIRAHTDNPPHAHRAPDRHWTDVMKHFWPALVGLAVGAIAMIEPTEGGGFALGLEAGGSISVLTLAIGAVYLPIGAVRRDLGGRGVLAFETMGVLFFGAFALAALLVDPPLAQYLLAAA